MPDRASLFALEHLGIKLGLDQIRALLRSLGHPDRAFPSIIVAGTNGKGSVTAMVERGLRAAGYRTGRYISPHLVHLEERFAIDGRDIAADVLDGLVTRIMQAASGLETPPSFFEATTAIALESFRDAGVEAAVLEVGLGGRLDATNAVDAPAVAITSVDYDHQAYLGHTLEEIAREKAGVIKPGGLAVLAENQAAVCRIVIDVATDQRARLVYAPEGVRTEATFDTGRATADITTPSDTYSGLRLALRGRHQLTNAVTAIRLLEELTASGLFAVPAQAIRSAVEDVTWPARLELISGPEGDVLLDGAHNPAGASALASYVREAYGTRLPIVFGAMADKRIDDMAAALGPVASAFICVSASSPRAASAGQVAEAVARSVTGIPAVRAASVDDALRIARSIGSPVVVGGSLYLAGEIRAKVS